MFFTCIDLHDGLPMPGGPSFVTATLSADDNCTAMTWTGLPEKCPYVYGQRYDIQEKVVPTPVPVEEKKSKVSS